MEESTPDQLISLYIKHGLCLELQILSKMMESGAPAVLIIGIGGSGKTFTVSDILDTLKNTAKIAHASTSVSASPSVKIIDFDYDHGSNSAISASSSSGSFEHEREMWKREMKAQKAQIKHQKDRNRPTRTKY